MRSPHPTSSPEGRSEVGRRRGFVAATASFLTVFAAGATPIPLYTAYAQGDGITAAEFSLVAVGYFMCAVFALLVLGRLSDVLGRRPVGLAAVVLAIAGCFVLAGVHGFAALLLGRGLQGLAAGLASSALAAYVVDTAPAWPRWLVPTITSAATNVGLAIGAFGSGALVDLAPAPRVLVFAVAGALLTLCGVGLAVSAETVALRPGALASLRPRFALPTAARPFLLASGAVFVATWALGGYFQSFGPSVAAGDLGSSNALVAAAVFASYLAPSALGGPLSGRLRPATAQRVGITLVVIAAAGFVAAVVLANPALFIAAGVLGGVGMGVGLAGSMRGLLPTAAPADRGGLLSLIYAASYTGAAVPSLVAGQLSRTVSLLQITTGYGALVLVAALLVMTTARNPAA